MLSLNKQWNGRSGIYQIRSKTTNERYVGQSVNLYRRLRDHIAGLKRGNHSLVALQNLFDLNGDTDLEVSVVMFVEREKLQHSEQLVIDLFNKHNIGLLNKVSNGAVTMVNVPHHLPTRTEKAVSRAVELRKLDPTRAEKMRLVGKESMRRLRENSDIERKRKIKAAISQRRLDVRSKKSKVLKALSDKGAIPRFAKGHIPHNKYKVIHLPTNTEFDSLSSAAEWAKVSTATISRWVNGRNENGKQTKPKHSDWERANV